MNPQPYTQILFGGRHHLLTRYQAQRLHEYTSGQPIPTTDGHTTTVTPGAPIIFAVTSASHRSTRRNPIPANQREAAIERLATLEHLNCIVIPIPDLAPTARFTDIVANTITQTARGRYTITPETTLIACSTPELITAWQNAGYTVTGVELDHPGTHRPGDILDMLGNQNPNWRQHTHPASTTIIDRYNLEPDIIDLYNDPVLSADGSLTETQRGWRTYIDAFDRAAERKWELIRDHIQPGRIVDIGCAAGALLEHASQHPNLTTSDLYGIDISRHLLAEAEHRRNQGHFANPSTTFIAHNMLTGSVFAPNTVNTTITAALTHEIYSYAPDRTEALRRLIGEIHEHTTHNGIWINADVCGPNNPDEPIHLQLTNTDGTTDLNYTPIGPDTIPDDHQAGSHAASLSTAARYLQFAADFKRYTGITIPTTIHTRTNTHTTYTTTRRAAMEYLTRKDYTTDSWRSECHEQFCHWDYDRWQAELQTAGFELDPASHPYRNDWLVEVRFEPVAALLDPTTGDKVDWPDTHLLIVARRP